MNNYERIKAMSIEEMAEFIDELGCTLCEKCKYEDNNCIPYEECVNGLKLWLESEVKDV